MLPTADEQAQKEEEEEGHPSSVASKQRAGWNGEGREGGRAQQKTWDASSIGGGGGGGR